MSGPSRTGVKVYGCNHVAIEVDDIEKAVAFYRDVFNLEKLDEGEGDAFFKLGEHQFLAMFEVEKMQPESFGNSAHPGRLRTAPNGTRSRVAKDRALRAARCGL